MYLDWFGLKTAPFNNTPDPRFFFNTPDHEEALASLLYAARERKGFVLVTGEVGSGKTLLSRMLLGALPRGTRSAAITNTRVTGCELLLAVCREFGIAGPSTSSRATERNDATSAELSHLLEDFLLAQYSKNRLAVVILDEAQNLSIDAFEELRLLGNLEADDAKLLQVIILGQPELMTTFRDPALRQLHQRIFRTFHLTGLSLEQTHGYVAHRLEVAGKGQGRNPKTEMPTSGEQSAVSPRQTSAKGQPDVAQPARRPDPNFTESAIQAIHHHAGGVPRLINQICDNAMLAAYAASVRHIDAELIQETVAAFDSMAAGDGGTKQSNTTGTMRGGQEAPMTRRGRESPSSEKPERAGARRGEHSDRLNRWAARGECRTGRSPRRENDLSRQPDLKSEIQKSENFKSEITEFPRDEYFEDAANLKSQLSNLREELAALSAKRSTIVEQFKDDRQSLDAAVADTRGKLIAVRQEARERLLAPEELTSTIAEARERVREKILAPELFEEILAPALDQALKGIVAPVEAAATRAGELRAEIVGMESRIASLGAGVDDLRSEISNELPRGVSATRSELAAMRGELSALRSEMAEIRDQRSALAEELNADNRSLSALQEAKSEFAGIVADAQRQVEETRASADRAVAVLNKGAESWLNGIRQQARLIRADSETAAADVLTKFAHARRLAGDAREEALTAARGLRDELTAFGVQRSDLVEALRADCRMLTGESLAELRDAHSQLADSAGRVRNDLTSIAEEIRRVGAERAAALAEDGDRIAGRLGLLRTSMRDDADQQHARMEERRTALEALAERVEAFATETRQAAEMLQTQAQASATSILEEANRHLTSAAVRVDGAAQQAQTLLNEASEIRRGIAERGREIQRARDEALAAGEQANRTAEEAAERSRDVLGAIERASSRTEELLRAPSELIGEAGRRAAALAELSSKLTGVTRRMAEMGLEAEDRKRGLERGTADADQKLALLRQHTQRVGQLVGIIRQLYGTMDARVERMRERLALADELCRVVPREIDALRDAVAGGANLNAESKKPKTEATGTNGSGPPRPAGLDPAGGRLKAKAQGPELKAEGAPAARSLGDIAARNLKLNAWLQGVLKNQGDAAMVPANPAVREIQSGAGTAVKVTAQA